MNTLACDFLLIRSNDFVSPVCGPNKTVALDKRAVQLQ